VRCLWTTHLFQARMYDSSQLLVCVPVCVAAHLEHTREFAHLQHCDELIPLPLIHLRTPHKREVHTQRAVDTRTVQTHENPISCRSPSRVFRAAIKASLLTRKGIAAYQYSLER